MGGIQKAIFEKLTKEKDRLANKHAEHLMSMPLLCSFMSEIRQEQN